MFQKSNDEQNWVNELIDFKCMQKQTDWMWHEHRKKLIQQLNLKYKDTN